MINKKTAIGLRCQISGLLYTTSSSIGRSVESKSRGTRVINKENHSR